MRILLLAPQPFYQDRGTPIAVDMLINVLSTEGHEVDVLSFPGGKHRFYPGVQIRHIRSIGNLGTVGPGFSFKKLYMDMFLFFWAWRQLRCQEYDLIHAVEEAAFIAWPLSKLYKVPYIYDMDSLMSSQLLDKFPFLSFLKRLFRWLESLVIRNALSVAPMCEDLAQEAYKDRDADIYLIKDVSLINESVNQADVENIRQVHQIVGPIVMYIGNLESYQGIDLLVDAFAVVQEHNQQATLVIIGGNQHHIEYYSNKVSNLGLSDVSYFIGPRTVEHIGAYLSQADILVSPRIRGTNTPMKIYSYLHSGVPVVATRLPTHTQVLNDVNAVLTDSHPAAYAEGLMKLLEDIQLCLQLGQQAREYAAREHGFKSFVDSVKHLYSAAQIALEDRS